MVLFTNTETKFERIVLSLVIALILLIVTCTNSAFSQQDQEVTSTIGIKITSPVADQQVPVGELTISGVSTDNATTDCTVYADWNDQKPFQRAIATGLGGENDYSTWTFTYTQNYHLISNGTNNLTSKISCLSNPTNVTKWNSVNVVGEVDLTTPENDTSSREEGTSFEGQNLTTIGNQTRNITDVNQINTSLDIAPDNDNNSAPTISRENDTAKTAPTPNNNNTGNPIIDFFRGMFGT
ncbi:MAG: hypothetical protein M3156_01725 [Thermoproteota archaeon]|nr:hypothetical protein [Thermoproteota archaeon]